MAQATSGVTLAVNTKTQRITPLYPIPKAHLNPLDGHSLTH